MQTSMKIKSAMLSKEALAEIVDLVRETFSISDSLILAFYKHDLVSQLKATIRQIENLEAKSKQKKLTRKEYTEIGKRHRQLCKLFHKKHSLWKELDNETNQSTTR